MNEPMEFFDYIVCKVVDRLAVYARSSLSATNFRKRFAQGKGIEKSIVQTVVDSAHRLVSCVILVNASRQRCVCFTLACRVLSHAGNLRQWQVVTPRQRANPAEPFHRVPLGWFLKGRPSLVLHVV